MTLEVLVKQLGATLKSQQLLLATAESCTGGGLSYWITSIPGSSDHFECGFVTYSNAAKVNMLGVNPNTLEKYGAVSKETACEMALGALKNSKADISIATTGIAGPDGGSQEKPVGTVWTAWAKQDGFLEVEKNIFGGNRRDIQERTIENAINRMIALLFRD